MRSVLLLLFLIVGSQAQAQTISVRSGEHESFSRLVFSIDPGQVWSLQRSGASYRLVLGENVRDIDASKVFERIPRNRISGFREAGPEFFIDIACDCHADAFLWRPDQLVVDIIDGAAPDGSEFQMNEAAPQVEPPPGAVALPLIAPRDSPLRGEPIIPGTFDFVPPSDSRVADAERSIMESLARAASQGVFAVPSQPIPFSAQPSVGADADGAIPSLPTISPVTDPMDGLEAALGATDGLTGPGLTIRTSIDRDPEGASGSASGNDHCIPDEQVSIQDWGDDRDFASQIADKRTAMTTELDVFPSGAIEAMARTYLFFGFGQEARQVLTLDGQRSRERLVLDAMSRVIDGLPDQGAVLVDQLDCDGLVVFWAALAAGSMETVDERGRNAVVMAFRLLPDAVRNYLGTNLANLFLEAGDAAMADIVLTVARTATDAATVESDLTSAAIIEELEGPQAAVDALRVLATENTRMTADGLVRLIDLQLSNDLSIDPALLDLAAAMRFEAGQSDEAKQLARAEVAALVGQGALSAALEIVQSNEALFADEDRSAAINAVFQAMAERQPETEFLAMAFGELPPEITAKAENAIGKRLIEIGFPERALEILAGAAQQEEMSERRYLRAEAAASMNDLAGVETALSGINDRRATEIRSRVLAATGDYEQALAQDLGIADGNSDTREAWRAGAWPLLEAGDDPLLQTASRAVLNDQVEQAETPTLAAGRTLLEQAEATRALTDELLGRFSIQPDG